jgi:hypothetical protein
MSEIAYPGHASLRSLWWRSKGRRCTHASDWKWSALLSGALQDAQQTFSASPTNLVRIGRSHQDWWLAIGSCLASHLILTKFCAVDPHPVQKDGEFTGDSYNGTTASLSAHEQRICGGIQGSSDD